MQGHTHTQPRAVSRWPTPNTSLFPPPDQHRASSIEKPGFLQAVQTPALGPAGVHLCPHDARNGSAPAGPGQEKRRPGAARAGPRGRSEGEPALASASPDARRRGLASLLGSLSRSDLTGLSGAEVGPLRGARDASPG